MGKGLKLLLGAVFGLLVVFAVIGVKSMLGERKLVTQDNGFIPTVPQGTGQVIPPTDPTLTTQDVAIPGQDAKVPVESLTLEGEPVVPGQIPGQIPGQQPEQPLGGQTSQTGAMPATTAGATTPALNATTEAGGTAPLASTSTTPVTTAPTQTDAEGAVSLVGEYGKLSLTVMDSSSPNGEIDGEFLVYDVQGMQVASFSGGETTSFDLVPGSYRVKVTANGKESSRILDVYADKITNAKFEMPTSPTQAAPIAVQAKGQLLVTVRAAEGSAPIRSNIYVQKKSGEHVAKTNYADGGDFLLEPGKYRITVKADGRKEMVRDVSVSANGVVRETFAMPLPAGATAPAQAQQPRPQQQATAPQQQAQATQTTQTNPRPQNQPATREGVLRVNLLSGEGLPAQARFVIRDTSGNRVAVIGPAPYGEIKLPAGTYEVTAGIQGVRQSRMVEIGAGRTNQLNFNAADIAAEGLAEPAQTPDPQAAPLQASQQGQQQGQPVQPPQAQVQQQAGGVLRLHAVSGVNRQPLKVNFTVSTAQGVLLQRFSNVSYAEVRMPPQAAVVAINYDTMQGVETIQVKPGEPTDYTFTISPKQGQAQPMQQPMQQPIPELMPQAQPMPPQQTPEEALINTLQQEILRRMQQ